MRKAVQVGSSLNHGAKPLASSANPAILPRPRPPPAMTCVGENPLFSTASMALNNQHRCDVALSLYQNNSSRRQNSPPALQKNADFVAQKAVFPALHRQDDLAPEPYVFAARRVARRRLNPPRRGSRSSEPSSTAGGSRRAGGSAKARANRPSPRRPALRQEAGKVHRRRPAPQAVGNEGGRVIFIFSPRNFPHRYRAWHFAGKPKHLVGLIGGIPRT